MSDINTGVNEDYKQMVEKLEREKRGMYEEMKAERERRQALEEQMSRVQTEIAEVRRVQTGPRDENLEWVTEFAKNGKAVLHKEVGELLKPIRDTNAQLVTQIAFREAMDWVAEEEGATVSKLKKNGTLADLDRVAKEKNLLNMPPLARAQAAYEFLKLERKQKEEEERARNAAIQANGTQPVGGTAPVVSSTGRIWKESEIAAMDIPVFQHHMKDIQLAKAEGRIVADISGKK